MSKKGLAQAGRALQHVLDAPVSPTGMPSPEEDLKPEPKPEKPKAQSGGRAQG